MQPGSPFVVPLHQLIAAEAALDQEHAGAVAWRAWAWIWFVAFALTGAGLLAVLMGGTQ